MRASVSMPAEVWPFSIFDSMPRLMPARAETWARVSPWRWRSSWMAVPTDASIGAAGVGDVGSIDGERGLGGGPAV